jgi:hypothetical protein
MRLLAMLLLFVGCATTAPAAPRHASCPPPGQFATQCTICVDAKGDTWSACAWNRTVRR